MVASSFPSAIWQWVKVGRMSYFQTLLLTLASNAVMLMICRHRNDSLLSMKYDGILLAVTDSGSGSGGGEIAKKPGTANTNSYELALHHSLGYFDDIPAEQWQKFFVEPVRTAQHYVNPIDPNAGSDNPSGWYYNNWIPVMACPHLIKLGGLLDGGKWTCDPERIPRAVERRQQQQLQQQQQQQQPNHPNTIASGCLVYSIGSRGNFYFETALFDLLGGPICEVHVFDFSGDFARPWHASKNIFFHPWGLKSSYATNYDTPSGGGTFYTLPEMQRLLGHEGRTIDIFKVDCETCEWFAYKDWLTLDIRQISIETHELPLMNRRVSFSDMLLPQMEATELFDTFYQHGFVLFSKEINAHDGTGSAVEWSFIKMHPDFFSAAAAPAVMTLKTTK